MDCRIKSGNDDLTMRTTSQEPLRVQKRAEAHFAES
jgi:hypothetical protein